MKTFSVENTGGSLWDRYEHTFRTFSVPVKGDEGGRGLQKFFVLPKDVVVGEQTRRGAPGQLLAAMVTHWSGGEGGGAVGEDETRLKRSRGAPKAHFHSMHSGGGKWWITLRIRTNNYILLHRNTYYR